MIMALRRFKQFDRAADLGMPQSAGGAAGLGLLRIGLRSSSWAVAYCNASCRAHVVTYGMPRETDDTYPVLRFHGRPHYAGTRRCTWFTSTGKPSPMISSAKPAYKVVLNNKQISFIADHSFDEISSVEKISLAATQPSPNSFRIVRNSWQFLTIMPASDPLASFNKMHIVEYGLTIIGRDPVTHQMCASERCQSFAFCGREEKVGAKRKKTGNVKYFDKFKTQYYEQLVKTQHA